MIITRLRNDSDLEYVNCGHIPPVWICGNEVLRPSHGNLPVSDYWPSATYASDRLPDEARGSPDSGHGQRRARKRKTRAAICLTASDWKK